MDTKQSKNANLHRAKKEKNDEFYTQLSDIENELKHYKKHFKNKVVMLPCDDPMESYFTIYFLQHFKELGLKRLICTCYKGSKVAFTEYTLFDYIEELNGEKKKSNDDDGIEKNGYVMDIKAVPEQINEQEVRKLLKKKGVVSKLNGDGDFRSDEVKKYLEQADIVVTNPPFSLWREFVAEIIENNKDYLVVGNQNAIGWKGIFELLQSNKMWLGYNNVKEFIKPDGQKQKFGNVGWFTNLDIEKRHEKIDLFKTYYGHENEYPKYDNYDAIEVSKVENIPNDYDKVMGVPITFMNKYNPEQFEIVGLSIADSPLMTKHYQDYIGYNQDGTRTGRTGSTFGACPVLTKNDGKTVYYKNNAGHIVQATYGRLFIKRK